MAALYRRLHDGMSSGALARAVQCRLRAAGIVYHLRTVRRHLSGEVATVPVAMQEALRAMLLESGAIHTPRDIEAALERSGLAVPPEARRSRFVAVDRVAALVRLWLYLNPGRTKRSLTRQLVYDLEQQGCSLSVDALQTRLAGKGHGRIRREVLEQLLAYLQRRGIASEREARARLVAQEGAISRALTGREFTSAATVPQLAELWQIAHKGAPRRRLAARLLERLDRQGMGIGIDRLQAILAGRQQRVQRQVLAALEQLVEESLPAGQSISEGLLGLGRHSATHADLGWVDAAPVAAMAQRYLQSNPRISKRRLAVKLAALVHGLGYHAAPNTIQSVLSARRQRTRGFVQRAMVSLAGRSGGDGPPQVHDPGQKQEPITPLSGPDEPKDAPEAPRTGQEHPAPPQVVAAQAPAGPGGSLSRSEEEEICRSLEKARRQVNAALVQSYDIVDTLARMGEAVAGGQASLREVARMADRTEADNPASCNRFAQQTRRLAELARHNQRLRWRLTSQRLPSQTRRRLMLRKARNTTTMVALLEGLRLHRRELRRLVNQLASWCSEKTRACQGRPSRRVEAQTGLTAQELRRLCQDLCQGRRRSQQAKDRLLEANTGLVVLLAQRYAGRGLSLSDLIQEGSIGLTRAIDRYDLRRGYRFGTYASWWIRQAIGRALADHGRTIRLPVHAGSKLSQLLRTRHALATELGREPTSEELAVRAERSADEVDEMLGRGRRPLSLDMPLNESETRSFHDLIADPQAASPLEETRRHELEARTREVLSTLAPRERTIIRMRFGIDSRAHTLKEVGQDLGISRERIRQIEKRALNKLRGPAMQAELQALTSS